MCQKVISRYSQVWDNLHENPRLSPSEGARICSYIRWFGIFSIARNLKFRNHLSLNGCAMGQAHLHDEVQAGVLRFAGEHRPIFGTR
jgi:hypothetical protein